MSILTYLAVDILDSQKHLKQAVNELIFRFIQPKIRVSNWGRRRYENSWVGGSARARVDVDNVHNICGKQKKRNKKFWEARSPINIINRIRDIMGFRA